MKICVYSIALNEAAHIDRFCASAADADLILIADTGSTDDTIARALAVKSPAVFVPSIYISPWRFDLARNAALALVPPDIDICVSLDLDEVLQPGWREEIERVWPAGTTRLSYLFDWGQGIAFPYTKIHSRSGYFWSSPCHEYPVPDGRTTEVYARTDKLLVVHQPDNTKSRGQYMDILQVAVDENPRDVRTRFYYCRELSFKGRWQEALDAIGAYLAMPEADWVTERCYAMRVAARCCAELTRWDDALMWARKSVAECPDTREPWAELAGVAYRTSRWAECFGAAMSGLAIEFQPQTYTCDPAVWGFMLHDYASVAAFQLGMKEVAISQARLAVEKEPSDVRLRQNLELVLELAA